MAVACDCTKQGQRQGELREQGFALLGAVKRSTFLPSERSICLLNASNGNEYYSIPGSVEQCGQHEKAIAISGKCAHGAVMSEKHHAVACRFVGQRA